MSYDGVEQHFQSGARGMLRQHVHELDADDQVEGGFQEMRQGLFYSVAQMADL